MPPLPPRPESYEIDDTEDSCSAVSWPAIWAGTFAAVAISLILFALGSGMGFAAASPWHAKTAMHFTCIAGVWLIITQWLSSAFGGYLRGGVRTKWVGGHTHEVFFRDTAHGFLTWAVATVAVTGIFLLAASAAGIGAAHMKDAGSRQETSRQSDSWADPSAYYVDSLYRTNRSGGATVDADTKAETNRIFARSLREGWLSDADRTYLAQLVSMHTGLVMPDAEKRVDEVTAQARQDADDARKAAAKVAIFTFLSMLIGAFIASVAAALGGKLRDEPYPHSL